jgi:hypothetical protein
MVRLSTVGKPALGNYLGYPANAHRVRQIVRSDWGVRRFYRFDLTVRRDIRPPPLHESEWNPMSGLILSILTIILAGCNFKNNMGQYLKAVRGRLRHTTYHHTLKSKSIRSIGKRI